MSIKNILRATHLAEDMEALSQSKAIIWFKPDGTVIKANENFCKTLKYELPEIVGKHHRMFCEDSIRNSPDYSRFWQELAAGQSKSGEFLRLRKDGKDAWIEASYNPVMHGGKVVRILKIASDITETKQRTLDDSNRLTAINLSQAMIEFTPEGVILGANDNFLSAMGYTASEIVGRHHSMFCDQDYVKSPAYGQFWQKLRDGTFTVDNFQRSGKGGRKVWIQAAYTPVQDARGRIYKVIKVASDITSRMNAVDTISRSVRRLAEGDLTAQITDKIDPTLEQTRNDFNLAIRSLAQVIGTMKQSAQVLATNAQVINTVSDEISRNAERQAASVEQTAAALDQITATVKDSSQRAANATRLVVDTRASAETSGRIVEQATDAMGGIEQSAREIENIISVIDEIAFQTNLLALNAGVEAARAGEAGKGFAVVAQEVRELAQRSASAAKDIKTLISKSSESVQHGVSLVNETGHALASIVQKVQEVDLNVQAIAKASQEQSLGLNEINTSINRLDEGTQKNAGTIQEANAASQTLADEAAKLYELIGKFTVPGQTTDMAAPHFRAA